MTAKLTTAIAVLGTLGVLLYASSKKANGTPKGPSPEPSPAPPQDGGGAPNPFRVSGTLCCPAGELLVGSDCKKYDGQGNYVYSGPAKICITKESPSIISQFFGIQAPSPSAPAIKCCDERDKNCKCTKWHWAASKDCKDAPCGGTSSNLSNSYFEPLPNNKLFAVSF